MVVTVETLFRQAPTTAADYMRHAARDIDEQFGEGFAKQHPELVAAYMQASALDYGASLIARVIDESGLASAVAKAPQARSGTDFLETEGGNYINTRYIRDIHVDTDRIYASYVHIDEEHHPKTVCLSADSFASWLERKGLSRNSVNRECV